MEPISTAFALAQFVPGILKWITGSDKAEAAAAAVIDIAKQATGQDTGDKALAALKVDPSALLAFRQAMADKEADLDKAFLADVQDARKRDVALGRRNYRADVMFLLAVLAIAALVWIVWKDPAVNEYLKGIVTLVLGRFLGYLDNIYSFEFGTTRSSRAKDDTIANLSK